MGGRHLRQVDTTNEDKVLFRDAELTKGDLIEYYERIADRILPHLASRPLVLQRFPDGIDRPGFYQKQIGRHFPDGIPTVMVPLQTRGGTQELVICKNKAVLVYLANLACIALHPWLSRRDKVDTPDQLVIDLDPADDDFEPVRVAALRVREFLEELDLPSFPKLTGSTGVHVTVPLRRGASFDAVRQWARSAMEVLAARHPRELTTEQRRNKRRGRLYLDAGRNAYGQTAVAPWSVRPLPGAPVAAPLDWSDLESRDIGPRDYTMKNLFRRTARRSDPWESIRRRGRSLDSLRTRLERLRRSGG